MSFLRRAITRWLSDRKRAGNTAVCVFWMHAGPLVKTQRRVLCKRCSGASSHDSLSEWRLEWGAGEGELREGAFTGYSEGLVTLSLASQHV